jgi:hypothetical protein
LVPVVLVRQAVRLVVGLVLILFLVLSLQPVVVVADPRPVGLRLTAVRAVAVAPAVRQPVRLLPTRVLLVDLEPVTLVAEAAVRLPLVVRQVLGGTLLVELGLQVCQLQLLALPFSAPVGVGVRARVRTVPVVLVEVVPLEQPQQRLAERTLAVVVGQRKTLALCLQPVVLVL